MGEDKGSKLFFVISWGTDQNKVFFQFFKGQREVALNVICGLPKMMEAEYDLDPSNYFVYKVVEQARTGAWDPITKVYKDENAIYTEGVLDDMVADIPNFEHGKDKDSSSEEEQEEK